MEKVIELIKQKNMFPQGATIGVACSGGSDSMTLLHFLNANKEKLDIEIVAIHVDHGTRENDVRDAYFVADYCKEHHIRFQKFKVEASVVARHRGCGIEQACREARYGVFDGLRKRGFVDRIALAHHQSDQAETVLQHILRGSGLAGASGMQYVRDDFYVRPFLDTTKQEIMSYIYENQIPYVEDETNQDTTLTRNFLRQKILPELRQVWPKVDETLCNFGKICKEDDDTIRSLMNFDAVLITPKIIKIPLTYFEYSKSYVSRLILDLFAKLGVTQGIEKKHIDSICEFAKNSENGAKISMPSNVTVHKEYEYITMALKKPKLEVTTKWEFKKGVTHFEDYGSIKIKSTKSKEILPNTLLIDADKVPENAVWRLRQEGDFIEKFGGGGIVKVKKYLSDKKVPQRLRKVLPMLAVGHEVLIIANIDIADSLKVTPETKRAYLIEFNLKNWV